MRRHWVGFLCRFGLKTVIHFTDFDLKSGWVFEGTTGVYEHFLSFQFTMSQRKRNMRIRNGLEEFLCLRSNG